MPGQPVQLDANNEALIAELEDLIRRELQLPPAAMRLFETALVHMSSTRRLWSDFVVPDEADGAAGVPDLRAQALGFMDAYAVRDGAMPANLAHVPLNLPDGLLQPPRRLGLRGVTPGSAASAPQAPTLHLFEDKSVKVSHDLVSGGRFGHFYHRGRELGGFGRAVVVRAVRGAPWDAHVAAAKFTAASEIVFNHVVRLILPCLVAPDQDAVLLPLDAAAFELTLTEFLHDASTDEQACLAVLHDVASGLDELHSRNLIHGRLTIEHSIVVSQIPGSQPRSFIAKVSK